MAVRGKESYLAIEFDRKKCLRSRSKWAECSLCVDLCPGQAIVETPDSVLPEYLESKCLGCGQCLSLCPLEAFTSPRFTESFLLDRLRGEEPLLMRCYYANETMDNLVSVQQECNLGVCFAALSPGFLFELACRRECVFDTEHCGSCPLYKKEHETMEINFWLAKNLLSSWGFERLLKETKPFLFSEENSFSSKKSNSERVISKKTYSDLRTRLYGTQAIKKDLAAPALFKTLDRRAPLWRMRLARTWKRLESAEGKPKKLLWPIIEVHTSRCRACGTCMQFCPTGALVHTLENDIFSYSFLPGLCVDCGLCDASCSSDALCREYQVTQAPFMRIEIFSRTVKYCVQCKSPFINGSQDNLCSWCSFEPRFQELIEYSKKHMRFDEIEKEDKEGK